MIPKCFIVFIKYSILIESIQENEAELFLMTQLTHTNPSSFSYTLLVSYPVFDFKSSRVKAVDAITLSCSNEIIPHWVYVDSSIIRKRFRIKCLKSGEEPAKNKKILLIRLSINYS